MKTTHTNHSESWVQTTPGNEHGVNPSKWGGQGHGGEPMRTAQNINKDDVIGDNGFKVQNGFKMGSLNPLGSEVHAYIYRREPMTPRLESVAISAHTRLDSLSRALFRLELAASHALFNSLPRRARQHASSCWSRLRSLAHTVAARTAAHKTIFSGISSFGITGRRPLSGRPAEAHMIMKNNPEKLAPTTAPAQPTVSGSTTTPTIDPVIRDYLIKRFIGDNLLMFYRLNRVLDAVAGIPCADDGISPIAINVLVERLRQELIAHGLLKNSDQRLTQLLDECLQVYDRTEQTQQNYTSVVVEDLEKDLFEVTKIAHDITQALVWRSRATHPQLSRC